MHKKNPYIDVINANGHDFVEIGGIKWATMNVGANNPWKSGLYFAWGETKGYSQEDIINGDKIFTWRDYNFGIENNFTKYNANDTKTTLDFEDDAAHVNWGGSWRMPIMDEYVALGRATNTAWTEDYQDSGVAGFVLTDKKDSSKVLFFPAAGYCSYGCVLLVGSNGLYWSSSLDTSTVVNGYSLYFLSSYVNWQGYDNRCFGFAVRGVMG